MEDNKVNVLFIIAILCGLYIVRGLIYRLFLSPVSNFPGPRLAAATFWYEFYYDVIGRGRYNWKIEELHKQYGPIVRVNPKEIHIDDPEYYDEVFPGAVAGRRVEKWSWEINAFPVQTSVFSTVSHELHRKRRASLSEFFSKRAIGRLENVIRSNVDRMRKHVQSYKGSGIPVILPAVFSALTGDVICDYCLGADYGLVDSPAFAPAWHNMWVAVSQMAPVTKQFPLLGKIMRMFPNSWVVKMNPDMGYMIGIEEKIANQVEQIKTEQSQKLQQPERLTIIHSLIDSNLPAEEKETVRLSAEALFLVAAGSATTSHVLTTIAFHLLDQPKILSRLQRDLAPVLEKSNGAPPVQALENIPYLAAVVKEGLRIAYGVVGKQGRVNPDQEMKYKQWTIPKGTPVSMSNYFMHNNENAFPSPRKFDPERWLAADSRRLDKFFTPFSKGTRNCIGMNLAYAEIYLTLSGLFDPSMCRLELFETNVTDVETAHDYFTPWPRHKTKGARVLVR